MKFLNIIFGFIYALCPLLIALIISLIIYSLLPNFIGVLLIVIFSLLSIWLGIKIFQRVQLVGFIEFKTGLYASPDLDNLKPLPGSNVKELTPSQLTELISTDKHRCSGGTLRIYGNWFGNPYTTYYKINRSEYNSEVNLLTIILQDDIQILIYGPSKIFESYSYLKIIEANKIEIIFKSKNKHEKEQYYLSYKKENNKINTQTNLNNHIFDVFPRKPALMFFN